MAAGKCSTVDDFGTSAFCLFACGGAAAIFEHGLPGSLEEFFRIIVLFEEQASAASESVFENEGAWQVECPSPPYGAAVGQKVF